MRFGIKASLLASGQMATDLQVSVNRYTHADIDKHTKQTTGKPLDHCNDHMPIFKTDKSDKKSNEGHSK